MWPYFWTNLNSHHPRMLFSQVWLKLVHKKIFKVCWCIFAISLLSPLRKGRGPSFEQNWIPITIIISPWKRAGSFNWINLKPLHQRMLCAYSVVWLKLAHAVVLKKKSKIGKVYRRTDRQTDEQTDIQTTDDRRSEKLTWAFSSGELKSIHKEKGFRFLWFVVVQKLITHLYTH